MGFGISYIPAVTIVPLFCEKYRPVALGVAVSGAGVGTFCYPPLIRLLVHWFGWRGAMLISGGVTLNICVCGALMRLPRKPQYMDAHGRVLSRDQAEKVLAEKDTSGTKKTHGSSSNGIAKNGTISNGINKSQNCKGPGNGTVSNGVAKEPVKFTRLRSPSRHFVRLKRQVTVEKCRKVLNLQLFRVTDYLILALNNVLLIFSLSIVYVHLPAFSEKRGISKDAAAILISTIGISNVIGRVAFGLLAKVPFLTAQRLYMSSLTLAGLVIILFPHSHTYVLMQAAAAAFGFFSASIGPLLPILIGEFLSVLLIPSGYGYLLVFEAIGNLLGPPAAGK